MALAEQPNGMRMRGDWMVRSDDEILELIREHGNLTPGAIEEYGGPTAHHAGVRCRKLAAASLLHQLHRGLYGITDEGLAYLSEEFDASTTSPDR